MTLPWLLRQPGVRCLDPKACHEQGRGLGMQNEAWGDGSGGVESWHLHQVVYWPGFPEACYKPQSLAALCMHWMVLPGWQWSWLHGSEPEGSLARRTQSASPEEGEEQVNLKSLPPGALPKAPLTLSMLCCRRSLPRTASCCLNSSFRGSAREGGGAIYR